MRGPDFHQPQPALRETSLRNFSLKELSAMLSPRTFVVCVLALVVALGCIPAVAQISSLNFASMQLNGSAIVATNGNQQVLRLTQDGLQLQAGSAWWMTQQSVG